MLVRLFFLLILAVFIIGIFDPPLWPHSKWGFIDKNGKMVIPAKFDRVRGIGEGNLAFTFRIQKNFHEGLAAVAEGKNWGFIDKTGNFVVAPKYEQVGDFAEGLAAVEVGKKCGFVDHNGKEAIPFQFEPNLLYCNFMYFHDGLCPVGTSTQQVGYIDKKGQFVVRPSLFYAWPFSEEHAVIFPSHTGRNFLIDTTGKTVFTPDEGEIAGNLSEGLLRMNKRDIKNPANEINWFVDSHGKKVTPDIVGSAQDFSEDLAVVNLGSQKFGYINKNGETVIKPSFDKAESFHEGLAAAAIEEKSRKYHYKWGYINKKGDWVIEPKYDGAESFSEERAVVRIDSQNSSKWGFIDKTGQMVIPAKYSMAFTFSEGLAAVNL